MVIVKFACNRKCDTNLQHAHDLFRVTLISGAELFSTQFHCFANNSLVTSSIIDLRPDSRVFRAGLSHTVLRFQKTRYVFEKVAFFEPSVNETRTLNELTLV